MPFVERSRPFERCIVLTAVQAAARAFGVACGQPGLPLRATRLWFAGRDGEAARSRTEKPDQRGVVSWRGCLPFTPSRFLGGLPRRRGTSALPDGFGLIVSANRSAC